MSIAELLDALSLAPSLPGALCKGRAELFDTAAAGRTLPRAQVVQAQYDAIQLCAGCPALAACRDYVNSMEPWLRPRGVVAGQLNAWREQTLPSAPRHDPSPTRTIGVMNGDNTLGSVLRSLRESHHWRQRDLAALVATQQNRVADWEAGNHVPTLPVLQRIAAVYEMTVSEILDGVM